MATVTISYQQPAINVTQLTDTINVGTTTNSFTINTGGTITLFRELIEGTGVDLTQINNNTRIDVDLGDFTTTDLVEGTNLYYTNARVNTLLDRTTTTLTTSTTTPDQVLDSWTASIYRSSKYQIQISSGTDYETLEMLVIHDGTTASQITYANVATGTTGLTTFNVDILAGAVRLLTTPTNAVTTIRLVRTAIIA